MTPLPGSAVILAGGLGTRLRGVLPDCPKVLAPVRGRPFLSYLLDQLADAGVVDVILATGYRADLVETAFGASYRTMTLRYSAEKTPLGTAGALANARRLLPDGPCLTLNGDSMCDTDLAAFWSWSALRRASAALVAVRVPDASRYGTVALDGERVVAFEEKRVRTGSQWINAGIYFLGADVTASLDPTRPASLERDVLPARVGKGLLAFPVDAPFLDIGLPDSYASASVFLEDEPGV
ncbi:MAG: nucleotidyltransferase family protein [Gemmatimonadaceae bacterium]|nr:nucleotidyltransferase family protein [Gemmatimonadaceae bacterium]